MNNQLTVSLLTGALLLAGTAQAQPGHWHVRPGTRIFLDGQPSTLAALDQVPDSAVACVEGRQGRPGTLQAFGDPDAIDILVLTTKAQANAPATLALADRAGLSSAYVWEAAGVRDVAPPALAYITAHYPRAWLDGTVRKLTRKSTGAVKYQVRLADNWGWRYLCFTPAGDFVDAATLGDGLKSQN